MEPTKNQTLNMKRCLFIFFLVVLHAFSQHTDTLPLNQYRFLASHNSYKLKPDPKVIKFLSKFKKHLSGELDPIQLDYGHELLTVQLNEYQVRGFELDLHYDPEGGHLAKKRVNFFIPGLKQSSKDSLWRLPGFKVLHIADVDYETNYITFKQALTELRDWSLQHPDHTPLFVNIEVKTAAPADYSKSLKRLGFHKAVPVDSLAMDCLDREILEVFSLCSDKLFNPSLLKGNYASVSERLDQSGWPSLKETRGKIFFILDGDPVGNYLSTTAVRPMFVYGEPGAPQTAFVIRNEPVGKEVEISALTKKYIVRTRSDAGTLEARKNDYTRFKSALESGAQLISTDYYKPDSSMSSFQVSLE
jgi:hypothetical protein